MFKKITIIITLLLAGILFYLANKFNTVNDLKFANAKDFVKYYEAANKQFCHVGIISCFASWVWVDMVAIKTKQLFWLWLPFLFTVFVAITNSYQEEQLFHFKKANGQWTGGFSLSYFFGLGQIAIAGFIILISYLGFKKYFKIQSEEGRQQIPFSCSNI